MYRPETHDDTAPALRSRYRQRLITLALGTALSASMLTGCASNPAPAASASAGQAQVAMASGKSAQAVSHAEAAVLAEPRSAHYRTMLGAAYLDAGRFASAATSFDDAVKLGDNTPRTALSLALALSASGKQADALGLLRSRSSEIPAADLGLAYSLAGEPQRGIHVITTAIRGGDNSAKARQNLAYSYAMAGQWREARIMASQDIPQDKVGVRMAEWAATIHPEATRARIAGLLGVPAATADGGQPVSLALSNAPDAVALAQGANAYATPIATPAAAGDYPQLTDLNGELPPIGSGNGYAPVPSPTQTTAAAPAVSVAPTAQPALAPLRVPARTASAPEKAQAAAEDFATSFGIELPVATPVRADSTRLTRSASAPAAVTEAPASALPRGGEHLVQLGSFRSEAGAERAWGIYQSRYPELANREPVITQAIVRGKRYWRVSAGGYARNEAASMCGRVKSGGATCHAWTEGRPMAGAVDSQVRMARR